MKPIWLTGCLCLSMLLSGARLYAACTTVQSDDFNRASLGANWTQLNTDWVTVTINSSIKIDGNGSSGNPTAGTEGAAVWAGSGSFTDDQCSTIAVSDLAWHSTNFNTGVIVRASTDVNAGRDYYWAVVYADQNGPSYTVAYGKKVNGTNTTFNSATTTWAAGDRIGLEAEGTTIRVTKNGTALGGSYTTTDSALTTGKPGIMASNSNPTGDDWIGGSVGGGAAAQTFGFRLRVQP